jgi:hypothetical protein
MVFQNDILAGASGAGGGYEIDQSIRFNDNDSAYLTSGTFGTATNSYIWTFSWWGKRGVLGTYCTLVSTNTSANDAGRFTMRFDQTTNVLLIGGYATNWRITSRVFRDPSAWLHIVVKVDTTQATAADRLRLYINGVEETAFTTNNNPTQNTTIGMNTAGQHQIGRDLNGGGFLYDGYMAEINFIDGQALAPTDFGETNDDGVWVPKAYVGTYGINGFYLKGQDSSNLGDDSSGNGNDFTSSGLTADDQVTDTPTENYCTLNPLYGAVSYPATFSNGNLTASGSGGVGRYAISTMGATSGKWYSEVKVDSMSTPVLFRIVVGGWSNLYDPLLFSAGEAAPQINSVLYMGDGRRRINNSDTTSWGATFTTGDVIGVAYDADTGKVWFAKNNTWQSSGNPAAGTNPAATLTTDAPFYSGLNPFDSGTGTVNFGQLGFTYTPPTGFSALSTANLPAPTITDGSAYFQATTYTGAGYPTEVNQSGNSTFQPDFVWVKRRNGATTHDLFDAVRGVSSQLYSNLTNAEGTVSNAISFDADGFTAAADPITGDTGSSGNTFVGWQWLAANGTASNTNGSITSTVSANTTAGFSIVRAASMASGTIGHGLSQAPDMVIGRMQSEVFNWWVWHQELSGGTYSMKLNDNSAQAAVATVYTAEPTSTVINTGGSWTSGNPAIFYCFHEVEGFSKFGKYTGNGSADGPFVWCGFRPAFILVKEYTSADDWLIYDAARDPYNVAGRVLRPDSSAAEFDGRGGSRDVDFLSNGFKFRSSNGTMNGSGVGYIFMAFAEHPFGGDGVAPVPAR